IGNLAIDTAGSLYAGSLIIQLIFPDVPMWQSVAALAAFTGMYTIWGGLAAVVYTDMFQSILLLLGSIVITVLAFIKIGSWDAVEAVARPEQLHLIQPASDETLPWPGLLTGVPLLGFYYWCSNQYIVQRALGARTTQQGQWGALFGGLLKVPVLFIMVMPGLMALVLYPNIENPNLVFPTLMFDLLPTGILGLVLAGFIAALMSSVDSALNAASTLATMDFYQKARPKADARKLMQTGRVFTLVFVVIAALIAPQIDRFPTLWEYLQAVLAYIAPPVVASFVLGMFWKRATPAASFAGLIGGGAVALFLLFGQGVLVPEIHFLYVATLLFALSAVIMIVVSFFTAETAQAKLDQYTWSRADYERESATLETLPWYYNYRYQSVALLAVTLTIVIYFW
ncbi:MAG: sodium/solute symporter, partial [Bacteroidota bacterium]